MNHKPLTIKSKNLIKSVLLYALTISLAICAMLPFFWMISTSLKTRGSLLALPIEWIPKAPTFDAYKKVFSMFPFARAIGNSLLISVCYTAITLVSSSMAAFAFTKLKLPFGNTIFKIYLASMMIPTQVTLIPLFAIMKTLNLNETYLSVIFPSLFRAFAVFMLVQTMKSIPNDFLEAARIDGAGTFGTYKNVVLPLCIPTLSTLGIMTFMESWNDFLWPLVMLTDKNMMTLPLALNSINGQYSTQYNILMAGSLISMIPIIIVFIVAQKNFKNGLMAGGIKG